MRPYSRNNGTVRVKNRSKYNSVKRKNRRTGYKVSNPTNFWDTFHGTCRGSLIRIRLRKAKGLKNDTWKEFQIDKI